jgi:succinyl-CoA synthetase beta subunit
MNLHEYQAKLLFSQHGIPIPPSVVVRETGDLDNVYGQLGGNRWVVKAQIHAGGRGKAGGVRPVSGRDELERAVNELLGHQLVTRQTDPAGLPINTLLVEPVAAIAHEYYLGMLVDRARHRVIIMASAAGGMDIEAVARETPDKIITEPINPAVGLMPYQARKIGFALQLNKAQVSQFAIILEGLHNLFLNCDASLIEINPLGLKTQGELIALDAKINLDDNALYRHPDLYALQDLTQENAKEAEAKGHELSYIKLEGDIGCMVNGAGLAMATMDLIKLHGGEPANFLDVGGSTTAVRVAEAFKLILSDHSVKAVLINIFGGIVRCDLIAEGIIRAIQEVHVGIPVVVRLEGTNVERGRQLLADSGLDIMSADGLTDAAIKVMNAIR